jgi:hypothetical protein
MKILLAVATIFIASAAKAEFPCQLSAKDYASLAVSNSKLTPAAVQALDSDGKTNLCETRQYLHEIDANHGKTAIVKDYWPIYLSPEEKKTVGHAVDAAIQAQLDGTGVTIVV